MVVKLWIPVKFTGQWLSLIKNRIKGERGAKLRKKFGIILVSKFFIDFIIADIHGI